MGHFFGCLGLFVWATSLLLILTEKGNASTFLSTEIQEIKEILRQREAADLQQRAYISRLTESLQVLTSSMESYVTMLEDGQTQGGSGASSYSVQLALVQNRLTNFQESVTEQLSEIKGMLGNNRPRPGHSNTPPCNNTLAGIQRVTNAIPRRRPYWRGYWGRDAMREDGIIYVGDVTRNALMIMGDNHFKVESIKEYSDEEHLLDNRLVSRTHSLTVHCRFQSIVIRNRRLYCAKMDNSGLLMYNLDTDQLIMQRSLSFDAKALYEGNIQGEIDLSADESWVWMIYAPENRGHLHLDKLDPESLETVATWETHIPQGQVGETFMMCGVLYSLNSFSDSPTFVKHMYSPWHQKSFTFESSEMMPMQTVNRHCLNYMLNALVAMAEYDHRDQTLYIWNCGYLEKYPVQVVDVDFSSVSRN